MAERVREVEETVVREDAPVAGGTRRVERTTTSDDGTAVVATGPSTAERIVYFISGIILTILAFRFILSLLGANRDNGFADFIYSFSYPFVAPFFGLFGYEVEYGVARFEIETLVAMAVYGLVAYAIAKMIRIARKEA